MSKKQLIFAMTSADRIKSIFDFKRPDRIGIMDEFDGSAIELWNKEAGVSSGENLKGYFDFDIRLFGFNQDIELNSKHGVSIERTNSPSTGECIVTDYAKAKSEGKFLALSFIEPFEHLSGIIGKEELLMMMAQDASRAAELLSNSLDFSLRMCQLLLDKLYHFDGAWIWGDLGYKDRLFFSTDYYNAFLFDLHKEICDFFNRKNMPVVFHSHGNISELMPYLIETGVRAVEPLENNVGLDHFKLKIEYGKDLVFLGGIDALKYSDDLAALKEIREKFERFKEGFGYIYRADSPITGDITLKRYMKILDVVKEYGTYS